jgi:phage terminase small subunit
MNKTTSPSQSSGRSVGVVALLVATAAFGSASAYLFSELRSEREHSQSLQARIAELEKARQAPQNPFAPVVSAPEPAVESAPAPTPAAPARPSTAPNPPMSMASEPPPFSPRATRMNRQRLLEDPEYRKAMIEQQKYAMTRMYPDLRSALRLQPQEAEQLLELLAEQQTNAMSNQPPFADPRNGPPDPAEMQRWQEQVKLQQQERDAQIAQLLGDAKFQEWQSYQKTLGARMQIRELRVELAEAGIPLREGQIEPLVNSLAAEHQRRAQETQNNRAQLSALGHATPTGRISFMEQELERTAEYNQRLRDAAAPYLSGDQLRRFDEHLSRQLQMQRANLQMMRAQQEAIARGDIPAPNAGGMNVGGMMRAVPAPAFFAAEPAIVSN